MPFHARGKFVLVCRRLLTVLTAVSLLGVAAARAYPEDKAPAGPSWMDYEPGLARAKKEGKPVIVDFYTVWCRDCKNMDKTTLSDPEVVKNLKEKFVAVKVDGDRRPDLASKYGVFGYPTFWTLDANGRRIYQRVGFMSKEEFREFMDYALTGAYKNKKYLEFSRSRKK